MKKVGFRALLPRTLWSGTGCKGIVATSGLKLVGSSLV